MDDLISRQAAIDTMHQYSHFDDFDVSVVDEDLAVIALKDLPSAQPTIYGYNIEHLELIAIILRKEGLSPERVEEALTDIDGIIAIVRDEFEESLRKAFEQCMI